MDPTTVKISESFRGGGDLCAPTAALHVRAVPSSPSSDFSPSHLLLMSPRNEPFGNGNGMYQFSIIPAREEPPLLLFLARRVHPACHELSTVKCLIQPPRSFKRRLLSTLTTTAPLLQLAVNFRVCSDIFSFDSRDFLLSCKMQSCKRAKAKYTLSG